MIIKDYGWNDYFNKEWKQKAKPGMLPGRIIADHGQQIRVITEKGELTVHRPILKKEEESIFAVGDWVALEYAQASHDYHIQFVLTRKTKFSRTAAGLELKEQIVASNVDVVFLIQSLNRDFNMRRLERYLITAWESGATPVVVLTKADCCNDVEEKLAIVQTTFPGVEVNAISSITGEGMDAIEKHLLPGKTIALLGSSGVGKSTLLNFLAGKELLKTGEIRDYDDKGRHTTTHRELVLLSEGALILDTPGMRSLSLWEADTGMEVMFGDIEELIKQCRFPDCKHIREPGCAVRAAIQEGSLDIKRWESWSKLQKELSNFEQRKEIKQKLKEKQLIKQLSAVKSKRQRVKADIKNMNFD